MRFTATAVCVLLSAVLGMAREVNQDDLRGCDCIDGCQAVMDAVNTCGYAKDVRSGDVFEDRLWIKCTCGQPRIMSQLSDCAECTTEDSNDGDILKLQTTCQDYINESQ